MGTGVSIIHISTTICKNEVVFVHRCRFYYTQFLNDCKRKLWFCYCRSAFSFLIFLGTLLLFCDDIYFKKRKKWEAPQWKKKKNKKNWKLWWAWVDSNHRPHPYQRCALTAWATRPYPFSATLTIEISSRNARGNFIANLQQISILYHYEINAQ